MLGPWVDTLSPKNKIQKKIASSIHVDDFIDYPNHPRQNSKENSKTLTGQPQHTYTPI